MYKMRVFYGKEILSCFWSKMVLKSEVSTSFWRLLGFVQVVVLFVLKEGIIARYEDEVTRRAAEIGKALSLHEKTS